MFLIGFEHYLPLPWSNEGLPSLKGLKYSYCSCRFGQWGCFELGAIYTPVVNFIAVHWWTYYKWMYSCIWYRCIWQWSSYKWAVPKSERNSNSAYSWEEKKTRLKYSYLGVAHGVSPFPLAEGQSHGWCLFPQPLKPLYIRYNTILWGWCTDRSSCEENKTKLPNYWLYYEG